MTLQRILLIVGVVLLALAGASGAGWVWAEHPLAFLGFGAAASAASRL